jgi:hypothetical protein
MEIPIVIIKTFVGSKTTLLATAGLLNEKWSFYEVQ